MLFCALIGRLSFFAAILHGICGEGLKISGFGGAGFRECESHIDVTPEAGHPWSGVQIQLPQVFDASRSAKLVAVVTNMSPDRVVFVFNVKDNARKRRIMRAESVFAPHGRGEIVCNLHPASRRHSVKLAGMNGYGGKGSDFDLHSVEQFTLFQRTQALTNGSPFRVLSIRAEGAMPPEPAALPPKDILFPFCDRYGQYRHADWPGKIRSDADLAAAREREDRWLEANAKSPIADSDRFGGWAGGPKLKATGFFRTEKVGGKWWLVDPDGHLFFSHGMAGVRSGDSTSVKGREGYFEWLPEDAKDAVSFQAVNLVRKYGADPDKAVESAQTRRRLRAWGFNTIGNWSTPCIWKGAGIPYTDTFASRARPIEGLRLAGVRMPDVFAPEFGKNLMKMAESAAERSGADPWCVGWFVDNELSWGMDATELPKAILGAPERQPARKALVKRLGEMGVSLETAMASPKVLESLLEFYAERYFSAVRATVKRVAPHRLYLGCRFCYSRENEVVLRVASKYCDVMSVNAYFMDPRPWTVPVRGAVDRPYLIGEFHFGSLEMGALHTGLVPVRDQDDCAAHYRNYIKAARASSRIVGAHWFLYRDQALTGRKDGECFQCGFVDVADNPYPAKVEAARAVAAGLYGKCFE